MTDTQQRPAFFNTLDQALIASGYDPTTIDQILWEAKAPKFLRLKLKDSGLLVFVELTSHSLIIDHKAHHAHSAPPRERATGPGHRVDKKSIPKETTS